MLIEHPDLGPMPLASTPAMGETGPLFDVSCRDFPAPGTCGADEEEKYQFLLGEAYAKFTELGFANPALRKQTMR